MKKTKLPNDYFPHDFNARVDRKILRCRKVLGIEGYGIYWMLIETLCTQDDFSYPLKDIDLLADDFGCSVEKVEAVVKQFELFKLDKDEKFFSLSLIARMQKYLELSAKARASVNVRWEKARLLKELQETNTLVLPPHNDSNTIKEKDIKEDKIKEDNRREKPPSLEKRMTEFELAVMEYKGEYPVEILQAFWNYWSEPNHSRTKMKKEMEKTWDTKRRLKTWSENEKKFGAKNGTNKKDEPRGSIDFDKWQKELDTIPPDA